MPTQQWLQKEKLQPNVDQQKKQLQRERQLNAKPLQRERQLKKDDNIVNKPTLVI